jgi:signal transduction histidine kinase
VAEAADVTVEANWKPGCTLRCTEDDLYQIVFNLMENGIKYNLPGGTLTVHLGRQEDNAVLTVSDTGMGIPEDALAHIFERFYRTDKGRSREQGGTGLGLAIVKHIIEAHGERINVRSELGVGTTFSFTLKKAQTGHSH